jgi:queuine tRNA-ribosyltransferase
MRESVERTLRWAKRCREEYDRQVEVRGLSKATRPLIFGVVQGGIIPELRVHCAQELAKLNFDGYGFGGRHIDSEGNFLTEILQVTAKAIPEDKLRFALGIGTPSDIVRCYEFGWDMFDCVIPTREGRHGRLFVWKSQPTVDTAETFYQTINIRNEAFKIHFGKLDPTCSCTLCTDYTPSYLHHLFQVGEPLALSLASEHNLCFYTRLMRGLREDQ